MAILALLVAGCARDSGVVVSPTHVEIAAAQVHEGATNWITIASDNQIRKVDHWRDSQTNSMVAFHLTGETKKRVGKNLCDHPEITRFRLLRAGNVLTEFDFHAAHQIGQLQIRFRLPPDEARQVVRELSR